MSRRAHSQANEEIHSILHDYNHMDKEDFETMYGIEISEDGSVHDPVSNKNFNSVEAWAIMTTEEEENTFEEFGQHSHEDY